MAGRESGLSQLGGCPWHPGQRPGTLLTSLLCVSWAAPTAKAYLPQMSTP